MEPIKTLLACWDEATETAVAVLGPEFAVTVVHTLDDAKRELWQRCYDLVVATIRFDESRPLELIPFCHHHNVPVALVRFGVSRLHSEVVAGVFLAARSLGSKATIDLTLRSEVVGMEVAVAELRTGLIAAASCIDARSSA